MTQVDFAAAMTSRGFTYDSGQQKWTGPFDVAVVYDIHTGVELEPVFDVYQAVLDGVDKTKALLGL